jgi:hypothetical protein
MTLLPHQQWTDGRTVRRILDVDPGTVRSAPMLQYTEYTVDGVTRVIQRRAFQQWVKMNGAVLVEAEAMPEVKAHMNQITSTSCAERFDDINRLEWLIVARREHLAEAWEYKWTREDTKRFHAAKLADEVLVVQRNEGRHWVVLARKKALQRGARR